MLATPEMISEGVRRLRDGGVVALPTETVYGIAAVASSERSVRMLIDYRGRDEGKPLPIAVSDAAMAEMFAESWPTLDGISSRDLARAHWPGPLTLVLPKKSGLELPEPVGAGLDTVGLRCPDHPLTLALIEALGEPVVLPSANRPGEPPATSAESVREVFGDDLFVIDGGPCRGGTPSTVLSFAGDSPEVLRRGGLSPEQIGLV